MEDYGLDIRLGIFEIGDKYMVVIFEGINILFL